MPLQMKILFKHEQAWLELIKEFNL